MTITGTKYAEYPKARMKVIHEEKDINALSHLSAQEKALAKKNLPKVWPSDGMYMMGNDPELQVAFSLSERAAEALLAPDSQMFPYTTMNLICAVTARLTKCEWFMHGWTVVTSAAVNAWEGEDVGRDQHYFQLGMLEFPDAKCWSAEQSLTIRFNEACLEYRMTDELYNEAKEMWGEKKLLRIIYFIGFVQTTLMMVNAVNIKGDYGTEPIFWTQFNTDSHKAQMKMNADCWEAQMELWNSIPPLNV
ncbi:MAG: hypothetical protein HKP58_11255 [Desulfatitalea sp.]|nr:hypothetical protein [Desulfatitalea sp.]NNK00979.1 hypothetical protein [Desulfatitalea sp.]